MNVKNIKKGFTLTELIIVIVIIGILAGVLIPTFINVVNKANKASDISLIRNLNEALTLDKYDKGEHKNMTQALEAAEAYGYDVAKISAKVSKNEILWDSQNDVFCYLNNGEIEYYPQSVASGSELPNNSYLLWVILPNVITDSEDLRSYYSTYLSGEGTIETSEQDPLTVNGRGLDTGKRDVAFVKYENTNTSDAKKVVLRTNSASTTLIIDDESVGSIEHYDSVGALNIIQCHTASYHENGKVAYVEISKGRIVLESGSKVEEIHINKKENEQAFDTVIIANNGGKEELPEVITRDAVTVESETLVVKVESNGSSENVYVYADNDTGEKGSTEKVTEGENKQNENVNSALGQKVLDNGSNADKAQTDTEKEAAKTEVVVNAIDDEKFDTAITAKKGSIVIVCSLAEFRDRVNGLNGFDPQTFEGYTITLNCNVDLKNEEWIPIGTEDHPFSGVFDGGNHTVRNLKITEYSASNGIGLFGCLFGDESLPNEYTSISQVWSNNEFNEEFFAESNYSARVSNVNVKNFEISSGKKYIGTLVGYAKNAYVSNSVVSNGTIVGPGKMGGVVGNSGRNMVIKDLVTESNVLITGTAHSVGGIIGGFNRNGGASHAAAAINCVNNANIVNNSDGVVGGIIGNLGNTNGLNGFVYNCINNGNISLNNNGSNIYVGGIVGDGHCTLLIANCTNNGNINHVSLNNSWYVGGISSRTPSGDNYIYNCVNNGDITAFAKRLAGITAETSDKTVMDVNCESNGFLATTNPNGAVYLLNGGQWNKQTYTASSTPISDIDGVNEKIDDNYSIYEFNGYGVINGELVINNTYVTIKADSKICSTVSVQNSTTQTVTLDIPGISCTISSDMSNLTLVMKGTGSQVTIAAGAKIGKLQIEGTDSTATINGEVKNLILAGDSNPSVEIATTGKCERISFSGSGNFALTNRGLISCTCGDQWGTWHVVSTSSPCTITINNYGTIESKTGQYDRCAYALLFYNGCDVVFNAYSGSHLTCEAKGLIMASWSSNSVTVNYKEGAELVDGGLSKLYSSLAGDKVTVNTLE